MPVSSYFKGDGRQVYVEMIRRYGSSKGKRVFYATAAKQGLAPRRRKRVRRKRGAV